MHKPEVKNRRCVLIAAVMLLVFGGNVLALQVCEYASETHGCVWHEPSTWVNCWIAVIIDAGNCALMFFISQMTTLILLKPDVLAFRHFTDDIISLLFPVYAIGITFTGIYIVFLSTSPEHRAKAKLMLMRMVIGMALVTISVHIYDMLLSVAHAIAAKILAGGGIVGGGVGGISVMSTMIVASVAFFYISSWILPILALIALVSLSFRYFMVCLMAVFFPLTVFFYFFDLTKSLGKNLMKYTMMAIFTQPVQALMLVIMIIGLNSVGTHGIFSSDSLIALLIGIAGLCLLIVAPLIMLGLMAWVGGAVAGAGMIISFKRPTFGAALVIAGGVGAGMGAESLVAGGSAYILGKTYTHHMHPPPRKHHLTGAAKGMARWAGKTKAGQWALNSRPGRAIGYGVGKGYMKYKAVGISISQAKTNVRRWYGRNKRELGKSMFIPGYALYSLTAKGTGISLKSRMISRGYLFALSGVSKAKSRGEVMENVRAVSGEDAVRDLKNAHPIKKTGMLAEDLQQTYYDSADDFSKSSGVVKNKEHFSGHVDDLIREYKEQNDFGVVEKKLRQRGVDDTTISRLRDRYDTTDLGRLKEDAAKSIKADKAIKHDIRSANSFEEVERINKDLGEYGLSKEEIERLKVREYDRVKDKDNKRGWKTKKTLRQVENEAWDSVESEVRSEIEDRFEGISDERLERRVQEQMEKTDEVKKRVHEKIKGSDEYKSEYKRVKKLEEYKEYGYKLDKFKRRGLLLEEPGKQGYKEMSDIKKRVEVGSRIDEEVNKGPGITDKGKKDLVDAYKAKRGTERIGRAQSGDDVRSAVKDIGILDKELEEAGMKNMQKKRDANLRRRGITVEDVAEQNDIPLDEAVKQNRASREEAIKENRDLSVLKRSAKRAVADRKESLERQLSTPDKIRRGVKLLGLSLVPVAGQILVTKEAATMAKPLARDIKRASIRVRGRLEGSRRGSKILKKFDSGKRRAGAAIKSVSGKVEGRIVDKIDLSNLKKDLSERFEIHGLDGKKADKLSQQLVGNYSKDTDFSVIENELKKRYVDPDKISEFQDKYGPGKTRESLLRKAKDSKVGRTLKNAGNKINDSGIRGGTRYVWDNAEEIAKGVGMSLVVPFYTPYLANRFIRGGGLSVSRNMVAAASTWTVLRAGNKVRRSRIGKVAGRNIGSLKRGAIKRKDRLKEKVEPVTSRVGTAVDVAKAKGKEKAASGRNLYDRIKSARTERAAHTINKVELADSQRFKKLRDIMRKGGVSEMEARTLIKEHSEYKKRDIRSRVPGHKRKSESEYFDKLKKKTSDLVVADRFIDKHHRGFTKEFFKPFEPSKTMKKAIGRGEKYGIDQKRLAEIRRQHDDNLSQGKDSKSALRNMNRQVDNEIFYSGGFHEHLKGMGKKYGMLGSEVDKINNHLMKRRGDMMKNLRKGGVKLSEHNMRDVNSQVLVDAHRSSAEIAGTESYNQMGAQERADYANLNYDKEGLIFATDLGSNLHARMLLEDYMGMGPRPSEFYHGIGSESAEDREKRRGEEDESLYTMATSGAQSPVDFIMDTFDDLMDQKR